jgi:hypothetical protein
MWKRKTPDGVPDIEALDRYLTFQQLPPSVRSRMLHLAGASQEKAFGLVCGCWAETGDSHHAKRTGHQSLGSTVAC